MSEHRQSQKSCLQNRTCRLSNLFSIYLTLNLREEHVETQHCIRSDSKGILSYLQAGESRLATSWAERTVIPSSHQGRLWAAWLQVQCGDIWQTPAGKGQCGQLQEYTFQAGGSSLVFQTKDDPSIWVRKVCIGSWLLQFGNIVPFVRARGTSLGYQTPILKTPTSHFLDGVCSSAEFLFYADSLSGL